MIGFALSRLNADAWRAPVVIVVCVLWSMMLARFVWESSFVPIPLPLRWTDNFLIMIGAVLIPAVALFQAPSERAYDIARRIILCGGAMAGVFLVATVLRLVREQNSLDALRRLGTEEFNPISLGNVAVSLVIVALVAKPPMRTASRLVAFLDSRAVRWTAGLLGVFLVIASASKGPIVALLGVIILAQGAKILRTGSVRQLMGAMGKLTITIAGMIVLSFVLGVFFNVRVIDRFVLFFVDFSTTDRVGMMSRALVQFEHSPWIGSTLVEIKSRLYPHNLFIEALLTLGIPGLCLLLVVLLAAFRSGWRLLQTRHDWVALLCAQQVNGLMWSGSLYYGAEFWVSIAAVFALDRLLTTESVRTVEPIVPQLALGGRV